MHTSLPDHGRSADQRGRSARGWWADLGLAAVAAVLGALFVLVTITAKPAPPEAMPLTAEVVAGTVCCLALLLIRRRWPIGLTLVFIPLALLFAAATGALLAGIFTVAVHRSPRATLTVAGLHATTGLVSYRLAVTNERQFWEALVVLLVLDAAVIASGLLVRSQRLLVRSFEVRARQAEEGQRLRVEEARLLERERLAREMHDVLAHRISLLAVHAGALEFRRTAAPEEARAAGVIRQCAYDALEDLRQVLGVLRADPADPAADRPQPTLSDLPALVEQSRQTGMPVTLHDGLPDPTAVPTGIGRHVYRIVQEGLTNARKHAPAAQVRVSVSTPAEGGLLVEVSNPLPIGSATAAIPGAGAGLIGLRERVDLLGGHLEHGRTADGDFRLRAWLRW